MSRYAFDEERHALTVSWGTGLGDLVATVAVLDASLPAQQALRLANELTLLSEVVWRTYTHPASAAESVEVNTEGWRREGDRAAFASMPDAIVRPNLPDRNGSMIVSYIPTEEAAHRVGRALHAIGDEKLTEQVVSEVKVELAAIEQSELGDLSGRARQAVMLSRAGASPAQVQAADLLLRGDPRGGGRLFSDFEPTAAAVAAAHWMYAAAEVASDMSDVPVTEIVMEADNIQALPVTTPTLVLEQMEEGASAYDVVTSLVRAAMAAAEGQIPDIETVTDQLAEAIHTAQRHGGDDPADLRDRLVSEIRTTPLDPSRPAHDLLEDLLSGIEGAWLIYRDHAYSEQAIYDDDEDEREDEDDVDDSIFEEFADLVRQNAADSPERLS